MLAELSLPTARQMGKNHASESRSEIHPRYVDKHFVQWMSPSDDENICEYQQVMLPTTKSAAERRGMMRYCKVLVVSLTWPGISLSLVKMHIFALLKFPSCHSSSSSYQFLSIFVRLCFSHVKVHILTTRLWCLSFFILNLMFTSLC